MSSLTLYRKYRPQKFADVFQQEYIITTLKNAIKLNRIAHSYIFCGPKGIGKTTVAKIFAKSINCLHPIDGDACNNCANCKAIDDNCPDILEFDAASNSGVDDIRKIIDNVNYFPSQLKKKVYIIDEAHMLSNGAWNALLKTIEDTPEHVIFIFATTEFHKIPATIVSRCQYFQFEKFTDHQIYKLLEKICLAERIRTTIEALKEIAIIANGAARDALTILDQLYVLTNNNINAKYVMSTFGLVSDNLKLQFINAILTNQVILSLDRLEYFSHMGANFTILIDEIIGILLDKLTYLKTSNPALLKKASLDMINKIKIDSDTLIKVLNIWQEQYVNIKQSQDPLLYFKLAIFQTIDFLPKNLNVTENITPYVPPSPKTGVAAVAPKTPIVSQPVKPAPAPTISKPIASTPKPTTPIPPTPIKPVPPAPAPVVTKKSPATKSKIDSSSIIASINDVTPPDVIKSKTIDIPLPPLPKLNKTIKITGKTKAIKTNNITENIEEQQPIVNDSIFETSSESMTNEQPSSDVHEVVEEIVDSEFGDVISPPFEEETNKTVEINDYDVDGERKEESNENEEYTTTTFTEPSEEVKSVTKKIDLSSFKLPDDEIEEMKKEEKLEDDYTPEVSNIETTSDENDDMHDITSEDFYNKTFTFSDVKLEKDKAVVEDSDIKKITEVTAPIDVLTEEDEFASRDSVVQPIIQQTSHFDIKDIIYRIYNNHSKESRQVADEIVNEIKLSEEKTLQSLKNITQTLFACPTGFIVVFKDKEDVDYFNLSCLQPKFISALLPYSKKKMYIVACTFAEGQELVAKLKSEGKKEVAIPDPNLLEEESDSIYSKSFELDEN